MLFFKRYFLVLEAQEIAPNLALKSNDLFFDILKIFLGSFGSNSSYILMYYNAISTTLTPVRCFRGKRYWDWTLPCIRAQIELSSTFVYDYKMSMSSSPAKNSHLTEGERTTMMSMPVNRIRSRCKLKLSQKYCPWINFQLRNFCHSFLQWMGSFFLIIMFCSAIHVYTDRFVIRPPRLRC